MKFKFEDFPTRFLRLELHENRAVVAVIKAYTYLTGGIKVTERLAGNFHEDNFVSDACGEEFIVSVFVVVGLITSLNEQESLSLDSLGIGRHSEHLNHVRARCNDKEELASCLEIFHGRPI